MKSLVTILIEAVVVGLGLIVFYQSVKFGFNYIPLGNGLIKEFLQLFIAGALFHLVFEYTGINKWYVDNYYA
jgi:ABC-type spermidine/putrescine transport system permease subunit II